MNEVTTNDYLEINSKDTKQKIHETVLKGLRE
jgi:hypothetical protein